MKPHFRWLAGGWHRVEARGKPHLRLTLTGRAYLVRPAARHTTQSVDKRRADIQRHYGSISSFARRWGFSLNATSTALSSYDSLEHAGQVRAVRLFLGLRSEPTKQAQAQAISKALARGRA